MRRGGEILSDAEGAEAVGPGADVSLRVTVPTPWAEIVGALLMDRLGPYAEEPSAGREPVAEVALVFYPGDEAPTAAEVIALLPAGVAAEVEVKVERRSVPRDWVDGWKDHFHPTLIGKVRIRPPWEASLSPKEGFVDVVINPGLGFGTGLHPTTRGTLTLLQEADATCSGRTICGPLVDAGTGSGILSIAAAKLGWKPVTAFDNDGVALASTRENVKRNGVEDLVEVHECELLEAPLSWFEGATVLANMTLGPVSLLVGRLTGVRPSRVVVSGILAGDQERQLEGEAAECSFEIGRRLYEAEWVSMEMFHSGADAGG